MNFTERKNNLPSKCSAGHPSASSLSQGEGSGPQTTQAMRSCKDDSRLQFNREIEEVDSFDDMGLKEGLLRGIYGYGFETPSPIQKLAVKPMIEGCDLLAQAQSGTGKTGAFTIASLQVIDTGLDRPQVLQLSPTRELAHQTFEVASALSRWMHDLKVLKIVGGRQRREDLRGLRDGAQFIVGTPGRVLDMIQNYGNDFPCDWLKILCLDEADEMLSRGFKDSMYELFQFLPQDIQVCLFSATMPREVVEMTEKFLRHPLKIRVKTGQLTLDGIGQYYVHCEEDQWKFPTLCDLYAEISVAQAIIFVNSKNRCEDLGRRLNAAEFTVSMIHGAMSQAERSLRMKEFKAGASRVLVSTDLLSRGIDCQDVQIVINYDLPYQYESYIHRIGRSGRFGRKGIALNFVTNRDEHVIVGLQRHYSTVIDELPQDLARVF